MLNKLKFKRIHKVTLSLLAVFLLIGLAERKHNNKYIQQIVINVEQQYDNFFVDRGDIHKLITNDNTINIIGVSMEDIDLREIEERIKINPFVKSVDVYKDLKGTLIVNVKQRRPIARIIRNTGPDGYVGEFGAILPVSGRFTARVALISGENVDELLKTGLVADDAKTSLLEILQFIDQHPFWKALVAQIEVGKDNELTIYPQVGKQIISFGTPEDYEIKFRNLKIFFKEILPQRGWNHYKRVNIKYNNQIVCE
ncbi:cell division protein FtsQ [Fulvivirgaceae bacterium BMA12]|uniref:Cell division protein FtsQ n=1 Tax=Agaribacillus aureus TaxID=3051825 RepID=A0ABT8L5Q8_9BACT|nr:cell division protein FtsQ [Fulvivirgaceae bacterium BMA12]